MTWPFSLSTQIAVTLALVIASFGAGFIGGAKWKENAILTDTVAAYQKRGKIDADVGTRGDYQLCVDLGGLPDKCDELRRVDKAAKGQ